MYKVLVYIDPHNPGASLGLLEAAERIAYADRLVTYAFCPGNPTPVIHGHFDFCVCTDAAVEPYDTQNLAACLKSLQDEYHFDAVLLPATAWGRNIAPRAAMRMRVGLVADITEVTRDGDVVRLVRPAFDGKMLAVIECVGGKPIMASVRPGVFRYDGGGGKDTQHITFSPKGLSPSGVSLLSSEHKRAVADIRESDILVSGGGGVGDAIEKLELLAKALGGMVSASRRLVDSGMAPRAIQVGQSGKTVSPRIYFALGIYGSLQHIEGLRNVDCIISVNTNPKAPICSISDIVVEGDAVEFAQKLAEKINQCSSFKRDCDTTNNITEG